MNRSVVTWGIIGLILLLLGLVVWIAWGNSPLVHVNEGLGSNIQLPVATSTPGGDTTIGDGPVEPAKQCVRAGCSNQLCVDATQSEGLVTTCEYREVYACYAVAACEVQTTTGECGFTPTEELQACIAGVP